MPGSYGLDSSIPGYSLHPSKTEKGVVELVSTSSKRVSYVKRRTFGAAEGYKSELEDYLFNTLSTITSPLCASKSKSIVLHNPTVGPILLTHVGKISYTWVFEWEGFEYEWRQKQKEFICWMKRPGDPDVDVCRAQPPAPASRNSLPYHGEIQMLNYNLDRFDTKDPKGLEITLVTTILSFFDIVFDKEHDSTLPPLPSTLALTPPPPASSSRTSSTSSVALTTPQLSTEDLTALLKASQENPNEITILTSMEQYSVAFYTNFVFDNLQKDDGMLFFVVRARDGGSGKEVRMAVSVAEDVKRQWYRSVEEDLHQYIVEDKEATETSPAPTPTTTSGKPFRRVINLDDVPPLSQPSPSKQGKGRDYQPPKGVSIYLSKIVLPDLVPKPKASTSSTSKPPPSSISPNPISKSSLPSSSSKPHQPPKLAHSSNSPHASSAHHPLPMTKAQEELDLQEAIEESELQRAMEESLRMSSPLGGAVEARGSQSHLAGFIPAEWSLRGIFGQKGG